ncbi:hypothetical protein [Methanomethylovorans sp.]
MYCRKTGRQKAQHLLFIKAFSLPDVDACMCSTYQFDSNFLSDQNN